MKASLAQQHFICAIWCLKLKKKKESLLASRLALCREGVHLNTSRKCSCFPRKHTWEEACCEESRSGWLQSWCRHSSRPHSSTRCPLQGQLCSRGLLTAALGCVGSLMFGRRPMGEGELRREPPSQATCWLSIPRTSSNPDSPPLG